MKKQLFLSIALLISLILTACNSDNDTNETSQPQPSDNTSQEEPSDDMPQEGSSGYDRSLVEFPEDYKEGVLYTTVNRGNMSGEIYTSREVIEAVQDGQSIPSGAVITYEIYRDGELDEIFVMEKRTDSDWDNQNPEGTPRTGDWLFQEFNGDRSLDYEEGVGRCFSCHANSERNDFVKRFDEMQSYDLGTASTDSDSDIQLEGVLAEDWEVRELVNQLDTPYSLDDEESSLPNIDVADNMLSGLTEDYRWSEVHQNQEKTGIIDQTLSAVYLQQFLDDINKNEFPAG